MTLLLCVAALPLLACKEDAPPSYSANSISQNEAYATQAAKMASETALKTATLPKLESSQGVEASFPLPVPTESKATP